MNVSETVVINWQRFRIKELHYEKPSLERSKLCHERLSMSESKTIDFIFILFFLLGLWIRFIV